MRISSNDLVVFLMGPTGAGKSTVLKTIYRDMLIDSGKIFIDQEDIDEIIEEHLLKGITVSRLLA